MVYYRKIQLLAARDMQHFGGLLLWFCFRALPGVLMAGLGLLLLTASTVRAENANPEDVGSGYLLLQNQEGGAYQPAVLHKSRVHFDINGLVATVRLEQTFSNTSQAFVEGVYAFPLPDDAAVRYLEMVIGERRIVGKIRERQEAKKVYQAAKSAGKKASLAEQQRPNLFTNRVANIGPGEQVTIHLEYVQPVAFKGNVFSLRFPTTITPRYMPGQASVASLEQGEALTIGGEDYQGWAVPTQAVPDAHAISPRLHPAQGSDAAPLNPIEISATLDMGMPLAGVHSAYHDIALSRRAGVYSIALQQGVSEMNRDFVLNWEPVSGSSPKAALFTEQVGEEHFGLLLVVPPAAQQAAAAVSREIVFVVDTSGSMGGVSIQQARATLDTALSQLTPGDRFNIIAFNSNYRALYRNPMPATRAHVDQARGFVRQLAAAGGTEMLPALRAALSRQQDSDLLSESKDLRQVVFITDGAVGNEQSLFEEVVNTLGTTRLFTVGIGSAPNSWFMRKAAEFGRGSHTHIGDTNEVGAKMATLFEQLSHPQMVDIRVGWPGAAETWPERIPDLYQGEPVSVAVRFGKTPPSGELLVSGRRGKQTWQQRILLSDMAISGSASGHDGIASLWARRKIAGLLERIPRGAEETAVRAEVLPLALAHQLLSPYTSFVAVEERITRNPETALNSHPVPNSRPRGQSAQPYAYPQTATTGPAKVWLGFLGLFVALLVRALRQPEADRELLVRD